MSEKRFNAKKIIKTVLLIIAVVFIGFVLFVVNSFTGNPISKAIAKNKLQQYVKQVYSSDFSLNKLEHNMMDNYYWAEFSVDNQSLELNYSSNSISDKNVSFYFQEKFNLEYASVLSSIDVDNNLKSPSSALIFTSIVASGNYSNNFEDLPVLQSIYLGLFENLDKAIEESDSKQMPSKLTKQIIDQLDESYDFTGIHMAYIDKFGLYEIEVYSKAFTEDTLLKYTQRKDYNDIGEEDRAFIDKLNS